MASVTTGSVDRSGNSATIHGSWNAFDGTSGEEVWFLYGLGGLSNESEHQSTSFANNGSYSFGFGTSFDSTYFYKARGLSSPGTLNGATLSFLAFASSPTFGTPILNSVSGTDASLSCQVNVNVTESTADVYIDYKRSVDPGYTSILLVAATQSNASWSKTLTGLLSSTSYDVRFRCVRTTANTPNGTSDVLTFSTASSDMALLRM